MKYDIVYLDMCEGEIEYASMDEERAEAHAYNQMYNAREAVLDEWDIDDPTEKDILEADFQAGFDGDCHEIIEVDISNLTENDMIELPDGNEIEVSEILEMLKTCE